MKVDYSQYIELWMAEEIRSKLPQIRDFVTSTGACSGHRFPQIFAI
jgi:hypothetical protein